ASQFLSWIRMVMHARRRFPDPFDPVILSAARAAMAEAISAGTAGFGDISNTLVTVPLLIEAEVRAHVFYELLRFNATDGASIVRDARAALDRLLTCPRVRV